MLLVLSLPFACRSAIAQEALDKQITLDINDHTRLEDALIEWGTKAGMALSINTPTVEHQTTPGVHGTLRADTALSAILRGSGLSYTVEDGTIRVVSATSLTRSAQRSEQQKSAGLSPSSATQTTDQDVNEAQRKNETRTDSTQKGSNLKNFEGVALEEVVVTAQKREERLIDVPISIVAITGEELQHREITRIDDLQSAVPGLAIQSNGQSRSLEIRGVANTGVGTLPLVGMYLDEAGVTSSAGNQLDLNTYDMKRVEVLRGPQGTLFGQGSVGGTIRFITNPVQLDTFAMKSDVAALFTQDGAPSQRIDAVVNVPIVENTLGLRLATYFDHEGGWINQPAADRKDINSQDLTDVRVKGLWVPAPQLTVSAMADIHRNNTSTNMGEDGKGNYTQVFGLSTTPSVVDNFNIYNLTLTYEFSPIRVLSTTSYVNQNVTIRDEGFGEPLLGPPATTPLLDFYYPSPEAHGGVNLSEELRVTSADSGPWQWTIGGSYQRFRDNLHVPYSVGPAGPLPAASVADQHTLSKSRAIFGNTSYKLADRLTIGAGIRYFRDDQEFMSSSGGAPATTQTGAFHAVSPRGYAQFQLAKDVNVYASGAKGFRSGGFNSEMQPSYGPETVWTYELGSKMTLAGGRLNADIAVFYSDYTNYQINGLLPPPAPPVNIFRNAGSAWIKGVDWDLTWRPTDNWALSFNGEGLDTRFYKINVTSSAYAVGDELSFVPKTRITLSTQRDFNWNSKPAFLRLDYSRQGHESFRNRSFGDWYYDQTNVIHMLNFNSSLYWNRNLRLGVFAQNLLNDRDFVNPFFIAGLAPRSRPRTYGVEFGITFD